jgi:hypothetical protein
MVQGSHVNPFYYVLLRESPFSVKVNIQLM